MDTATVPALSVAYAAPFPPAAPDELSAACAREIARLERMSPAQIDGLLAFADLPPFVLDEVE